MDGSWKHQELQRPKCSVLDPVKFFMGHCEEWESVHTHMWAGVSVPEGGTEVPGTSVILMVSRGAHVRGASPCRCSHLQPFVSKCWSVLK